uniref:Uncharacterized protein n=1 Tax=Aegilops tauschii subsp. strangulata TaxID=200361 RepID=A0A453G1V4_AEGTS
MWTWCFPLYRLFGVWLLLLGQSVSFKEHLFLELFSLVAHVLRILVKRTVLFSGVLDLLYTIQIYSVCG